MGAKSLCIPFEQPVGDEAIMPGETKCPQCGRDAKVGYVQISTLAITNIYCCSSTACLAGPTRYVIYSQRRCGNGDIEGLLINIHISSVDIPLVGQRFSTVILFLY